MNRFDIWIFGALTLLGALAIWKGARSLSFAHSLLLSLTAFAACYALADGFLSVSNNPFSASWSESSQLYYASTFLAKPIYGFSMPLPAIKPALELMQAVPYLAGELPIWVHRLWTQLLWAGFTLAAVLLLARRLAMKDTVKNLLFIGWSFLFLYEIPVYYDLLVCVVLIILGFTGQNRAVRIASLAAASIWAGLTRVNWYPMPGVLAAVLYLLETPVKGKGWRYFLPPILWVVSGTALAVLSSLLFVAASGNPLDYFATSFQTPLLWYRLFPSASNRMGILPQITAYALPAAALACYALLRKAAWDWRRPGALVLPLAVFFAGGIIVSVKMGGGNNIHNLDAFLVLLWVMVSTVYAGRFVEDRVGLERWQAVPGWAIALGAAVPILVILPFQPIQLPTVPPQAGAALEQIQALVDEAQKTPNSEVLFITERQLVTFHSIQRARLAPEYEKSMLMEMSMSRNQGYLRLFHQDLRKHRFALIITEPVFTWKKGRDSAFGEENDLWLKFVTNQLLENYQSVLLVREINIEVFVPKP